MPVPASKTTSDFNGKWIMKKELCYGVNSVLILQGINYFLRSTLSFITPSYDIKQYTAPSDPSKPDSPSVVWVDTTQSAAGLKSSRDVKSLDDQPREQTDWMFGTVVSRSKWVAVEDIDDDFLSDGWLVEGEGKTLIVTYAEHKDGKWTAAQVGGFRMINGERFYAARVVLTSKDGKRAEAQVVSDYVP